MPAYSGRGVAFDELQDVGALVCYVEGHAVDQLAFSPLVLLHDLFVVAGLQVSCEQAPEAFCHFAGQLLF